MLDALHEAGRDVPTDVAVIGFDSWEVLAAGARPPLSSVDINPEQLGRVAAKRLLAAIDGSLSSGTEVLPCRVVPRGSTTPLAETIEYRCPRTMT